MYTDLNPHPQSPGSPVLVPMCIRGTLPVDAEGTLSCVKRGLAVTLLCRTLMIEAIFTELSVHFQTKPKFSIFHQLFIDCPCTTISCQYITLRDFWKTRLWPLLLQPQPHHKAPLTSDTNQREEHQWLSG